MRLFYRFDLDVPEMRRDAAVRALQPNMAFGRHLQLYLRFPTRDVTAVGILLPGLPVLHVDGGHQLAVDQMRVKLRSMFYVPMDFRVRGPIMFALLHAFPIHGSALDIPRFGRFFGGLSLEPQILPIVWRHADLFQTVMATVIHETRPVLPAHDRIVFAFDSASRSRGGGPLWQWACDA